MLPLSFKRSFDIEFLQSLYDHLQGHDESLKLVLRTKSGRKTDVPSKAGIGEIRNSSNKPLFGMGPKEGIVHMKHAGELRAPLLAFLKEQGVARQEVSFDTGIICILAYAVLVAGGGLVYTVNNYVEFLYPYILSCLAFVLSGLALMAYSYKPDQEKWVVPSVILLAIGALPTSPASLLTLPMIKSLGRAKLKRLLNQDGEGAKPSHT
ncbi:hypothetical protein ACUY1T_09660 [Billgrantia sp. Q4P2]|uniref:hypothetical protein n=1 Tax=Billgrantia sp. Q4P2 TaxID=3463857 RepID=UPI0040574396